MQMEILAPAGGEESLFAAAACGADAVYLGGGRFTARRGAKNFDDAQLELAVSYCHARKVKVYLTVNTLVLEDELGLLPDTLRRACQLGVDGVMVQDLAIAALARRACPDLPLFASTQMAVTGAGGAKILKELGFSRLVLARELTLDEIRAIRNACDIGLEAFVHGALCMSVSGQCYLSAMLGGRSGNRGLCAQPCRLPFAYGELAHALSLKDLTLLDRLGELEAAGVSTLKIEGRMKRPEYVSGAVSACRKALDGEAFDLAELAALFSRGGFTQGYLDGKRDIAMFGARGREDVTAASPSLLEKYAALYRKERPVIPVDFTLTIRPDRPALLSAADGDGNAVCVSGAVAQRALTAPTDEKKARESLSKTGGTIFYARELICDIDPGLMLPASGLNALRRDALEQLMSLREQLRPIPFYEEAASCLLAAPPARRPADSTAGGNPALRIRLERASQLFGGAAQGAQLVFLPVHELDGLDDAVLEQYRDKLAAELPKYAFGSERKLIGALNALRDRGITKALTGSLDALRMALDAGLEPHGDFSLNIANTLALESYRELGLSSATVSFEATLASAKGMGGSLPRGILAYGYLPLMHFRNCPVRANNGGCKGYGCDYPALTDRKGKRFFLRCDGTVTALHNCIPLWMGDKTDALSGLDFLTLYFTKESPAEIDEVLRLFQSGGIPADGYTRGLYYRGVM